MRLFILVLPFILFACASPKPEPAPAPAPPPPPEHFITPAGLEPQVDFWRKVYSEWSQGQIALHDDRHLDLVYAVLRLPGSVEDGYSRLNRQYVKTQKKLLQQELSALEHYHRAQLPLTPKQQQLAALINNTVGEYAIWGAADRVRSQRGLRERFKRGIEISGRYLPAFKAIFREAGLPEDLAYLPHVESSFQAHARSSAGATGMWQFTRGAAKIFMANHPSVDERLDPIASAKGAARYLKTAYGYLQNWPMALTSYNHGIGSMRTARERFGTDFMQIVRFYDRPSFGFASRNFYAEFLAARMIAKSPQTYFPDLLRPLPAFDQDSVVLAESAYPEQIARYYGLSTPELIGLNPAWTRVAITNRRSLPPGITVWLPRGALAKAEAVHQLRLADKRKPQAHY